MSAFVSNVSRRSEACNCPGTCFMAPLTSTSIASTNLLVLPMPHQNIGARDFWVNLKDLPICDKSDQVSYKSIPLKSSALITSVSQREHVCLTVAYIMPPLGRTTNDVCI